METIAMSVKERRRMTLMTRVTGRVLKLSVAAEMMRVSYRQAKRILRRYRRDGDAGLVHRGRGRSSNRTRPVSERKRAVALYVVHVVATWCRSTGRNTIGLRGVAPGQ